MPSEIQLALLLTFPAMMALGGSFDLLTMTIPNRVSLALVAAFPVAALAAGLNGAAIASHVAAGMLMLVIGIFMFSRGWLGGGDAKLMAAATLWLGLEHLAGYVLLVAVFGGVLAMLLIFYRRLAPPLWAYGQAWALRLHDGKTGIPYGIALAVAALWLYPSTLLFKGLAA